MGQCENRGYCGYYWRLRGCQITRDNSNSVALCDDLHENVETYGRRGNARPCVDRGARPIVANPHAAQPLNPTDGSLHDPTHTAEVTSVFLVAIPDVRFDPQPPQQTPGCLAIKTSV